MKVAKLTISYDRGTVFNKKDDIGAAVKRGDVAPDGGVIRGLGSRFRSPEAMIAAQARDKEAYRIYRAFRERFMTTTIDGLYIVTTEGEAQAFVESLNPVGIETRVAEFELSSPHGLDMTELSAWGGRIKRQLLAVGLGRKKEIEDKGAQAIKALSDCPLLLPETRDAVKNLVALLEGKTINRADFRDRLEKLTIKVGQIDQAHEKRVAGLNAQAASIVNAHVEEPRIPTEPGV